MIEHYRFERLCELVGVNAARQSFNSLAVVDLSADGHTNPMPSSGAIAEARLAPGSSIDERWEFVRGGVSRFAGRSLMLDDEVHESAVATNLQNRATAEALNARGRVVGQSRVPSRSIPVVVQACHGARR